MENVTSLRLLPALTLCCLFSLSNFARADESHDKFSITDLKIGLPLQGHAGFVCEKPIPADAKEAREKHCVKFNDERCKGKPSATGTLRYGENAPRGCYLDHSSLATYLDGKLMQTPNTGDSTDKRPILKPLLHLHIVGTASEPSKIWHISYFVAPDELTEDTKLYGALFKKYGEPVYKNPPREMRWKHGDAELRAECIPDRNCEIWAQDSKFRWLEAEWQKEADAKKRAKNAPDAPDL